MSTLWLLKKRPLDQRPQVLNWPASVGSYIPDQKSSKIF